MLLFYTAWVAALLLRSSGAVVVETVKMRKALESRDTSSSQSYSDAHSRRDLSVFQQNPKPGFMGACISGSSEQPSVRKDAYTCARELMLNTDSNGCIIQSGGREVAVIGCERTQIKVTISRARPVNTKLNCKEVGSAALEIIDNCAECSSDYCPVQGQLSKYDRYGLPYTVILTRGPLATCYGDGCVTKPDPDPQPTPVTNPGGPMTCYGDRCGDQGNPNPPPNTCYGDRCQGQGQGPPIGNPRPDCIFLNGIRYCPAK